MLAFFSHWELVLILVLALLLFGTRVPKLAKAVGKSIGEFRRGVKDLKDETGVSELQDSLHEVRRTISPRNITRELTRDLPDPTEPQIDRSDTGPGKA
jgi:sec-independent protein translocase protein TatA